MRNFLHMEHAFQILVDIPTYIGYAYARPGRPGAAEPCEPRQVRKEATVRRRFWVPPVPCPDIFKHYNRVSMPVLTNLFIPKQP
jgi:hypothetical protein